ncbi:MAG: TAXI family TRAP transporter solute-binding subunit [Thermodesulfobacteriota bacterium]
MKKRIYFLTLAIFISVLLASSSLTFSAEVKDLVLMSSVVGGIGYQYSMGVNKVIQKVLPDVRTTMEATPGYIDNAKRLFAGYGHLGIVSLDTARDLVARKGDFAKEGTPILALLPIHKLEWNIIVNADSPIKGVRDLEGKRVNLQPKGSSSEKTGTSFFNALGIKIQPSYYRHSEAADGMKTGRIDAHWLGGSNPVFMEYSLRTPLRVLNLSDQEIQQVTSALPHLVKDTFPAQNFYKGATQVQVVSLWSILMARADLPEDIAYKITKGIYENKEIMVAAHKGAEGMAPSDVLNLTVPLHPGAVKYYQEIKIPLTEILLPKK